MKQQQRGYVELSKGHIGLVRMTYDHNSIYCYQEETTMKTKQAYRRQPTTSVGKPWGDWHEVELTGRAKSITGGPSNRKELYYEVKRSRTSSWVPSDQITVCEPVKEVIYMDEALEGCSN
jgi:hypothetical protein